MLRAVRTTLPPAIGYGRYAAIRARRCLQLTVGVNGDESGTLRFAPRCDTAAATVARPARTFVSRDAPKCRTSFTGAGRSR